MEYKRNIFTYSPNKTESTFIKWFRLFISPKQMRLSILHMPKHFRILFISLLFIMIVAVFGMLEKVSRSGTHITPVFGGTLHEGSIHTPKFINPVLAHDFAIDQSLVHLVFSGLVRKSDDGTYVPALAESFTVSDDGTKYVFTLREGVSFHDGTPITADDVVFTITTIQDPTIDSPLYSMWEGVHVERVSSKSVAFTLASPFSAFLDNATVGIIPKHLWSDIPHDQFAFSELNSKPIGSGPFFIDNIVETKSGIPKKYRLKSFRPYQPKPSHIRRIIFSFFKDESSLAKAFKRRKIDAVAALSGENLVAAARRRDAIAHETPLPRMFSLFINSAKQPLLADHEIITALNHAIQKDLIIQEVLLGYGHEASSPVPHQLLQPGQHLGSQLSVTEHYNKALNILDNKGWRRDTDTGLLYKGSGSSKQHMAFSIATRNTSELTHVARVIQNNLGKIGITVTINQFDLGNLEKDVIRPRDFEMLLFGEHIMHPSNLYAFWHSSQIEDPGLNVALYSNTKVDSLLAEVLTELQPDAQHELYQDIHDTIQSDPPAIFLYAPSLVYLANDSLGGIDISSSSSISQRFINADAWYLNTNRTWKKTN